MDNIKIKKRLRYAGRFILPIAATGGAIWFLHSDNGQTTRQSRGLEQEIIASQPTTQSSQPVQEDYSKVSLFDYDVQIEGDDSAVLFNHEGKPFAYARKTGDTWKYFTPASIYPSSFFKPEARDTYIVLTDDRSPEKLFLTPENIWPRVMRSPGVHGAPLPSSTIRLEEVVGDQLFSYAPTGYPVGLSDNPIIMPYTPDKILDRLMKEHPPERVEYRMIRN